MNTALDSADLEHGLHEKNAGLFGHHDLTPFKSHKLTLEKIIDSPSRRVPRRMSFNRSYLTHGHEKPTFSEDHPQSPISSHEPHMPGVNVNDNPPPPESRDIKFADVLPPSKRDIKFADTLPHGRDTSDDNISRPVAIGNRDIKFADLELPPSRRKNSLQPHEMAMSISMMENMANKRKNSLSADGPALVIKGPLESDNESEPEQMDLGKTSKKESSSTPSVESSLEKFNDPLGSTKNSFEDNSPLHRATTNIPASSTAHTFKPNHFGKRSHTIERAHQLGKSLKRTMSFDRILSDAKHDNDDDFPGLHRVMSSNYVSWQPTIGGNSVFVDLTDEQREELGGVEYRALKLLSKILVSYFVGFHLLAALMLMGWGLGTKSYHSVFETALTNPVWWGFFTGASSFNDLGFTLTPNSMMSFVNARFPILVSSFFIVIGNTGFPCLLRLIIWVAFKCTPTFGRTHESLGFLLDHPRRCFTLLFPSSATWWLFGILVVFNTVDLILFICLDLNSVVVEELSTDIRIMAGLYQAFCTRTAGFSVIDLSQVHVAVQVSYMVMMYISVLPLAMSIRRTNVYEEQSLGVYYDPGHHDAEAPSLIATHLRKQLSFDLWFIFLGLFIIAIAEGTRLGPGDESFSIFSVLFEITSAYGTVGLSLGYPNTNTSFSGQFTTVSKLVIIALLYRGRHRGLPYSLDRAIILPSEKLDRKDSAQEHRIKRARELTMNSNLSRHPSREGEFDHDKGTATVTGANLETAHSHVHLRPVTSVN